MENDTLTITLPEARSAVLAAALLGPMVAASVGAIDSDAGLVCDDLMNVLETLAEVDMNPVVSVEHAKRLLIGAGIISDTLALIAGRALGAEEPEQAKAPAEEPVEAGAEVDDLLGALLGSMTASY